MTVTPATLDELREQLLARYEAADDEGGRWRVAFVERELFLAGGESLPAGALPLVRGDRRVPQTPESVHSSGCLRAGALSVLDRRQWPLPVFESHSVRAYRDPHAPDERPLRQRLVVAAPSRRVANRLLGPGLGVHSMTAETRRCHDPLARLAARAAPGVVLIEAGRDGDGRLAQVLGFAPHKGGFGEPVPQAEGALRGAPDAVRRSATRIWKSD